MTLIDELHSSVLEQTLAQFKLIDLHITLQLQGDGILPAYKGSMWHGWLGHALHQVSESAFQAFYQQHDHEQPKPYAMDPGRDQKTDWRHGELIDFSIRLFGSAVALVPVLIQAFQVGEALGLGAMRIPVKLVAIDSDTHEGKSIGSFLADSALHHHHYQMLLDTPLRLKQHGKILRHPSGLTVQLLALQCRRRLLQLTKYWVCDDEELLNCIASEPLGTEQCEISTSLYFEDWQRFSLKQQEFLPFGGFKGVVGIKNASPDFTRWLKIGEQLQLGGKSTFGLGIYRLVN